MNHGNVSSSTAKGQLALHDRVTVANIPSSRIDETLDIATWNVREFGEQARFEALVPAAPSARQASAPSNCTAWSNEHEEVAAAPDLQSGKNTCHTTAVTKGQERLGKAARALSVTSRNSPVTLKRNTARPPADEVGFVCHLNRRNGPCACNSSAHEVTLREALENPRKAGHEHATP
ncbi:MAG: hypothetical protein Q8K82_18510 [Gemmatimonadaceae bacterium]|nr:hypothetical protein [Gemmatimonadaceae bacterium]